jgi:signal transduction histidine kinase
MHDTIIEVHLRAGRPCRVARARTVFFRPSELGLAPAHPELIVDSVKRAVQSWILGVEVSQRSVETSLIRTLGDTPIGAPLEAPPIPSDDRVLIIGELGDHLAALEATLGELGARLKVARGCDAALELLEQEAFAFLLIDARVPEEQSAALLTRLRRDPQRSTLPIVFLTVDDLDLARATDHPGAAAPEPRAVGVLIAERARPAAALEAQLAMLLELHRSRARGLSLEAQLGYARHDLRQMSDDNALLAGQARRAVAELETAQAQLVQAAKLAALGELVAGVAHEINNPLSFSLSHMATLRRGINRSLATLGELAPETRSESARLEERLVGVTLGLDRIKSLVVKLQTFSRLDDGKSQPLDVADAIGTVLTILHHRMRDRIHLTTEFGKPDVIQCDPSLINQCVMNLLVNAIDAIGAHDGGDGPDGNEAVDAVDADDGQGREGNIHISARGEGDSYVIRVNDSGHGIPSEIEQQIFDPFFTTKPVGKGTGLGLSIASSVVKKHGGTLTLSPGANGGTEAVIRIPLGRIAPARRR